MDTSKTYIVMCESAEDELQNNYKPTIGDFTVRYCEDNRDRIGIITRNNYGSLYWLVINDDDGLTLDGRSPYLEKMIWLPRQDQLQEMVGGDTYVTFYDLVQSLSGFETLDSSPYEYVEEATLPMPFRTSMERVWLNFVMATKYSKKWNGINWVELQDKGVKL